MRLFRRASFPRQSPFTLRGLLCLFGLSAVLFCAPTGATAQAKRVVIVKCDGLSYEAVDRFVNERDPRTGKSQLPWVDHIFYQQGVRLKNFYVRGMSLSGPSWSLLETGQHLKIKGNVEFDRYSLHTYDYLNFIPYIVNTTRGARVDMPGVEVLDDMGEPLLIDAFSHEERYVTFSLFLRGPRFITYQKSLENRFKRTPRELFDEWTMGFGMREAVPNELAREMIGRLSDPKVKYLDLIMTDFDHAAHHNNDRESHLVAMKQIDNVLGQIWTAIQKSSLADDTALILVSDHGFNSEPNVYSQGYNLVKLLGSTAGGGHHVVTKRRLLLDYSIKGINPFVSLITTTTKDSYYLRHESDQYPTALLDFDGNERASIHLRDSDLNLLHLLLLQLQKENLAPATRKAVTQALFQTLDQRRPQWQHTIDSINEELLALRRKADRLRVLWEARPKKLTREDIAKGLDDETKRIFAQLERANGLEAEYREYARVMANLLALRPEQFDPKKLKIQEVIPPRTMGDRNTIYQLQNYVAGIAPSGLRLSANGSLDLEESFVRINYFQLLQNIRVRNNVQAEVSNRPVDMIATRIPSSQLAGIDDSGITEDAIWVYGDNDRQALILARADEQGRLSFRYLPIRNLTQDARGNFQFERIAWQKGLPLKIYEDEKLVLQNADREQWLQKWHTDIEWLEAVHLTQYSNGIIGLYEELAHHKAEGLEGNEPGLSEDEKLLRRLVRRRREMIETDMLLVANNHWNFDVRGFNPGGNHGSFFRVSTHSTLMIAAGNNLTIPRGIVVDEPYDSLSFVPTVLALTGKLRDDSSPIPILWERGFRRMPGRIIREFLPARPGTPKIAVTGETAAP